MKNTYEAVIKAAEELIGKVISGYEISGIESVEVEKIGGAKTGIMVNFKDMDICPIFYNVYSVEELEDCIMKSMEDGLDSVISGLDFEDHSIFRIRAINIRKNEGYLEGKPYRKVLDLALTGFLDLGNNRTAAVTDQILDLMKMSFDEFYEIALDNAHKETTIYPISSLLKKLSGDDNDYGDMPLYVVGDGSSPEATSLLGNQEWLEEIYEKLGGYYIIPSSVNELLITPAFIMPEEYVISVMGLVNSSMEEKDVLSDNLYMFDGKLSMIGEGTTAA